MQSARQGSPNGHGWCKTSYGPGRQRVVMLFLQRQHVEWIKAGTAMVPGTAELSGSQFWSIYSKAGSSLSLDHA